MKPGVIQQRKCRRCSRTMVSIALDINGRERILRSCSNCDIRVWETAESDTSLDGVLSELSDQARA